MKGFNFVLRLGLGGIFIAAGVIKIIEPAQFSSDIANYRLLPHDLINLLAITLPWVEVVAGMLLITGPWKRAGALAITVMMVVFLAAIAQATVRGLNIKCGCFGTVEGRKVGLIALAEDSAMLAAALWLTVRERD
jgi:putative oxidoreductase